MINLNQLKKAQNLANKSPHCTVKMKYNKTNGTSYTLKTNNFKFCTDNIDTVVRALSGLAVSKQSFWHRFEHDVKDYPEDLTEWAGLDL